MFTRVVLVYGFLYITECTFSTEEAMGSYHERDQGDLMLLSFIERYLGAEVTYI